MIKLNQTDLQILRQYLYGRNHKSATPDLLSKDRIRAPQVGQQQNYEISTADYMNLVTGAGRFATGAMFDLVNAFFMPLSGLSNWPGGSPGEIYKGYGNAPYVSANIVPGRYTKQQMAAQFDLTENDFYGFNMQQYTFSDERDDLAARTFIYGSSSFKLDDNIIFVIEPNGTRYIEDFKVVPLWQNKDGTSKDNYDYESDNLPTAISGSYLQGQTDPSEVGQTVYFRYIDDHSAVQHYGIDQYQVELNKAQNWSIQPIALRGPKLISDVNTLLDQLWEEGTTYFVDSQNRPIVYGQYGDSEVQPLGIINQFGSRLKLSNGNGVVVVEDDGNDKLYGTIFNDRLIGNGGNDYLDGVFGADDIDGGDGNDVIFAGAGSNSLTVGGLGRDVINNNSAGGIIWGDLVNSSIDPKTGNRIQIAGGVTTVIVDDESNSDSFEFQAGTTIMDAGKYDRLTFFGLPLTGGDTTMTSVAFAAGSIGGPLLAGGFLGAVGGANLASSAAGNGLIYFDRWMPFITYKIVDNGDGGQELIVGNVLQGFLDGLAYLTGADFSNDADAGIVRVKDYDRGGGTAFFGLPGDLGMSFDDFNPVALLSLLLPRLAGVPIAQSVAQGLYYQALAVVAVATAYRYTQYTEALKWKQEGDPLVIDLDGDGIETIGLGESRAYFDVDGDMFAEKTGWLKGDDGFLVLDANANGRIDDISEMFGNRFTGGYDELAGYDSNGDGKITVADLVWSELKVWQDRDRDGETDAGELKSLSALGITEFSLASTALGATTPQGAHRRDAAANDNQASAWPERTFILEMAA